LEAEKAKKRGNHAKALKWTESRYQPLQTPSISRQVQPSLKADLYYQSAAEKRYLKGNSLENVTTHGNPLDTAPIYYSPKGDNMKEEALKGRESPNSGYHK